MSDNVNYKDIADYLRYSSDFKNKLKKVRDSFMGVKPDETELEQKRQEKKAKSDRKEKKMSSTKEKLKQVINSFKRR